MNRNWFLALFIALSASALLLFQNFTPSKLSASKAGARNAQSYVIKNRSDIDGLPAARHPYIENAAGIFEIPGMPNAKNSSSLNNPHRYNKCKGLYTPAAEARMRTHFFDVRTYGARGSGESSPFQKYKDKRTPLQISAHAALTTKMFKNPRLVDDDEMDWIGIQSAMVAAHRAGGGTVLIPDTGKNYVVTRPIWLYSNVRIIWLTNPSLPIHSYVKLNKPSGSIGTVFGSYNPYANDKAYEKLTQESIRAHFKKAPTEEQLATENLHRKSAVGFVCKSYFYEPRVIALTGENAISFAKGSYDIQIYGGVVKGARFGTEEDKKKGFNLQGGKGIQMESGVQQAIVDGLSITDSTIGLSASGGLYITIRDNAVRYANAADKITFRNISMNNVDLPFFLSNLAFAQNTPEAKSLAVQSVRIENFDLVESGRLSFKHPQAYTGQSYYLQSGIFGLFGGSNITVRNTKGLKNRVVNSEMIGSFVRGFGRNIDIKDIAYEGTLSSLIDLHTPMLKNATSQRIENFRLSNFTQEGRFGYLFRSPSPLVERTENGSTRQYYVPRLQNVTVVNIMSSGGPVNSYFSDEFRDVKSAEMSSSNLTYEVNGRGNN